MEERSAGGIIVDVHEGIARIAVIARRNRAGRVEWCLPKGHMENGETLAEAAAREVAEETGIEGRVLTELGTIDYWFATGEHRVHKYVHHYLLEATGGRPHHRERPRPRGHRRRLAAAARGPPSTSPSPTSGASPGRPGSGWPGAGDAPARGMPRARRGIAAPACVGLALATPAEASADVAHIADVAHVTTAQAPTAPTVEEQLEITLAGVSPTIAQPGQSLTLAGTIRNRGTAAVARPLVRVVLGSQALTGRQAVARWAEATGPAQGREVGPGSSCRPPWRRAAPRPSASRSRGPRTCATRPTAPCR